LARNKTGSLFAFVGYLAGSCSPQLAAVTRECGYLAGTAYQLADDIFDSYGDSSSSDKTLGLDARKPKTTAVSGWRNDRGGAPKNPVAYIQDLLSKPEALLKDSPAVLNAWHDYRAKDLGPAIEKFVKTFSPNK